MRGSCSNALLRSDFICNKCQRLLIIYLKLVVLLHVVIKGILF